MRLKEIKLGVIHCKTQEEADALVKALNEDVRWSGYWNAYRNDTCYKVVENRFYSYGHYVNYREYQIIEFADLVIPELSAAEVLRICNEICATRENGNCSTCKMYHNCFFDVSSYYQKVVEICEKWKADHEKKEPEFEWIWEGRIYEIHDNDKGNFYQLDDGNGFYDTGCTCQESAEDYMTDVLKDYCSTHEGEYIAIVDRVCRVKQ